VPETRDEALEMGMADALISKLSGAGEITVRPLSTVRRFGGSDQDAVAAGRELGVQAVMDGNIQISGDRLRVTASLIRVSDQKQLWTGKFDEKLTDIFSVQDSISSKVASELRIPLTSLRRDSHTDNIEAYQLYMKGVYHAQRLVLPEVQKGIMYFEQAIALDPDYAQAYVGLSQAYRAMVLTNDAPSNEIMPRSKTATQKALELDPMLADAWTGLAISDFWYDWDSHTAESHHLKALELDPKSAMSHFYYAHMLSNTGRHEEALAEIRRAREIDPVLPVINALEGQILTFAGRYDDALTILRETTEANPDFWLAHLFLARAYLIKGMYAEALASATKARELARGNSEATAAIGRALVKLGRRDEALNVMSELEGRAKKGFVPSYALAQINLAIGNRTKALELLGRGTDEHDALMVFLKVDPEWDELRSDARFMQIMKQLNF
ncbi:MAG: tetratricopeptide repeat protein, partial [Acidobacteriota bacterium]